ncbi:recombination protein RecR [bacterium]|nr:recombination protein RecR [bacterium]
MKYGSKVLECLIDGFSHLPGIGEKSAQRIALYLLESGQQDVNVLISALTDLQNKIKRCSICFNFTEEDPCSFCRDERRDRKTICVVEEPKDVLAIEHSGGYYGLYHVLGGVLSPLDGIGETDLHIQSLMDRIDNSIQEIILAMNPTMEGEMTASRLGEILQSKGVRVTRIARGIPFGGSLEFNDMVTVAKALEGRMEIKSTDS